MKHSFNKPSIIHRTIAYLIDLIVYAAVILLCLTIIRNILVDNKNMIDYTTTVSLFVFWFIYYVCSEYLFDRTLGKKIMNLHIIHINGNALSISNIIRRRVADILDFSFFYIPAYLAIKRSPLGQRFGDMWANTVVVYDTIITCPACKETVELEGKEILSHNYMCPYCGQSHTTEKSG